MASEDEIAREYEPLARSITHAMMRRYPWSDFDDLYSDALTGMLTGIRACVRDDALDHMGGYVRRSMEYECRHGVRARAQERRRDTRLAERFPAIVRNEDPGSDLEVREWLNDLPVKQREAAVLSACGYLQREIGDALGLTSVAISLRLGRARRDWQAQAA